MGSSKLQYYSYGKLPIIDDLPINIVIFHVAKKS